MANALIPSPGGQMRGESWCDAHTTSPCHATPQIAESSPLT